MRFIKFEILRQGNHGNWMNKKLVLELDHKDGNRTNDAITNLRFLCPNCHSQEPTSHRRKYKVGHKKITLESVNGVINECHSKREILIKLQLSDASGNYVTLNKILKDNNLTITERKQIKTERWYESNLARRKVLRPTKECLVSLITTTPMTKVGKMFGVSDNAVKKWCKYYKIVVPSMRGYWAKKAAGKL